MLSHSKSDVRRFIRAISSFLTLLILLILLAIGMTALVNLHIPKSQRGEFGSDLRMLASSCRPLQEKGESNFVIDLLKSGDFREFLRIHGLTNNHALFVLSHGRSLPSPFANRYAYYPDDRLLTSERIPHYSARDLAKVLGPKAAQIHHLVLAGCNLEGNFNTAELRKYFPGVTNITHTPAGKNGYEFVFRHGLIYPSEAIKLLYELPDSFAVGDFSVRAPHYQRQAGLSPYVAELFRPGASTPWKTQLAGRELFTNEKTMAVTAQASKPNTETLAAVLSTAIAAYRPAAVSTCPKSIIMLSSPSKTPAAESRPAALRSFAKSSGLDLAFLGIWRDAVLCGLVALCLFRMAFLCIPLAMQDWKCNLKPAASITLILALTVLSACIFVSTGSVQLIRTAVQARIALQ